VQHSLVNLLTLKLKINEETMKNIKKSIILAISAVTLGVAAVGAMANPYQHVRHIDHRENRVIANHSQAINRAYRHGNYHRAHMLTRQMNHRISHLDHERNRVIRHHF
jgi:isoaspartyl peptidase/L-asparaginase-like protein (Ntn-hydrolase superfamily)